MKSSKNPTNDRRRRKLFTILWATLLGIATIALIYWEMTALLYILATLGVTALLIVVALSDLARAETTPSEPGRIDDSAAIGSGISSTFGTR